MAFSTCSHLLPRLKKEWGYTSTPTLGLLYSVPNIFIVLTSTFDTIINESITFLMQNSLE